VSATDLKSILPTFYEQLLCVQIPNAQKDTDDLTPILHSLGSKSVNAARYHVGEIDP